MPLLSQNFLRVTQYLERTWNTRTSLTPLLARNSELFWSWELPSHERRIFLLPMSHFFLDLILYCFTVDIGPTSSHLINYATKIAFNGSSMEMKTIPNIFLILAVYKNRISLTGNRSASNVAVVAHDA